MTQSVIQDSPLKQFLDRVMVARQLTSIGAMALDDIEPGRQLLSLPLCRQRHGAGNRLRDWSFRPRRRRSEKFRQQKGQELK